MYKKIIDDLIYKYEDLNKTYNENLISFIDQVNIFKIWFYYIILLYEFTI